MAKQSYVSISAEQQLQVVLRKGTTSHTGELENDEFHFLLSHSASIMQSENTAVSWWCDGVDYVCMALTEHLL